MSDQLKDLIAAWQAATALAHGAAARAEEIRQEAAKICTHPTEWVIDQQWHHGYGHYVTGEFCKVCHSERGWKGNGSWRTAEEVRRSRLMRDND